jgi:hypothetical protein
LRLPDGQLNAVLVGRQTEVLICDQMTLAPQKSGSGKIRRANFLQRRFWMASGLPTIRVESKESVSQESGASTDCGFLVTPFRSE